MNRVKLKPISVNDAWKGKRYRTDEYRQYQHDLGYLLPPGIKIPEGKLEVWLTFGFSNDKCDADNPVKPTVDILAAKYQFNDRRIYRYHIEKEIVPKGQEYIEFKIKQYMEAGFCGYTGACHCEFLATFPDNCDGCDDYKKTAEKIDGKMKKP